MQFHKQYGASLLRPAQALLLPYNPVLHEAIGRGLVTAIILEDKHDFQIGQSCILACLEQSWVVRVFITDVTHNSFGNLIVEFKDDKQLNVHSMSDISPKAPATLIRWKKVEGYAVKHPEKFYPQGSWPGQ